MAASTREPRKSRVVFSVCSRARYTRNPSLDIDLLSVVESCTHEEIGLRYGEEELDECVECVVEGVVAVEAEDAEVDVAAAQRRLQHREADRDPLQLQRVHLQGRETQSTV